MKTAEKQYHPVFVAVTVADVPVADGGVVDVCLARLTAVPSGAPVVGQMFGPLEAVKHS